MQKQLIIVCAGLAALFAGCDEPNTIPKQASNAVLCELNGRVGHYFRQTGEEEPPLNNLHPVIIERVVVYCDGTYLWEKPRRLEDPIGHPPVKGTMPASIYWMLKTSAASSSFTTVNGIRSFTFVIGSTIPPHPKGVDELFAYLYQKQ